MSLLYERLLNRPEPGHPMITEEDTQWTLSQFREQVNRLASVLVTQKGIKPGDRVATMFMNQKEALVSFFAILQAGGVVVPINIGMPADDITFVFLNSGSKMMLSTGSFAERLKGKPIKILMANQKESKFDSMEDAMAKADPGFAGVPAKDPTEMRILMYTSGTTGKPKGVMLSEQNLISNLDGIHPVIGLSAEHRLLLALPLFHAYGLIIGLYALDKDAALFLVPNFAPKKILQTLVEHQVSVLPLVPTMFTLILSGAQKMGVENFKHLKACISGGASLPEALLKQIEETLDLTVLEGYGLTETSPVLAVNSWERGSIPKSVGKPIPNVDIKLVDEAGKRVDWTPGSESGEGEILAKGPNIMQGYYKLDKETKEAFDAEGYFRTGDLGRFDAEGHLFISGGRKKDLIIKAGENIAPVRIEEVLYTHPAIQDASVIGVPDDKVGEEIVACIQFKPEQSATEGELKKFCLESLPAFMVPGAFKIYEELPKNPTGKILKPQLRKENEKMFKKGLLDRILG